MSLEAHTKVIKVAQSANIFHTFWAILEIIDNFIRKYLVTLFQSEMVQVLERVIPQTISRFPVDTASILVALPVFRKQVPPS